MADITPLPEISEAKASSLRKYFYEYVVIALVIAVCTLFAMYHTQEGYIINTLTNVIQRNTSVIEKNNDIIQNLKHQ